MSVGYVGGELVLSCDLPGFPSGCFVAGKPSQAIVTHLRTAGYGGEVPITLFRRPSARYWSR
jgi:hypothetical protein